MSSVTGSKQRNIYVHNVRGLNTLLSFEHNKSYQNSRIRQNKHVETTWIVGTTYVCGNFL